MIRRIHRVLSVLALAISIASLVPIVVRAQRRDVTAQTGDQVRIELLERREDKLDDIPSRLTGLEIKVTFLQDRIDALIKTVYGIIAALVVALASRAVKAMRFSESEGGDT